jgi:hypothetical protein
MLSTGKLASQGGSALMTTALGHKYFKGTLKMVGLYLFLVDMHTASNKVFFCRAC